MDIVFIVTVASSIASILFGLYQWWTKQRVVRLEKTQLEAETVASKSIEATNLMEVVNLFLKSIGLMRDELIIEIKKVSNQLDLHALQDTVVQTQINKELCQINEKMAGMKGDKGETGDTGPPGDSHV